MRTYLIIALLLVTASCQRKDTNQAETNAPADSVSAAAPADVVELTAAQLQTGGIELGAISNRPMGQSLPVNGRLAVPPQSEINITALLGGFVRSLPLLPGQPVRAGQVLARLENPDLIGIQQEYAETSSRLTYLETEQARQQELSQANVSALKVLQQTTADLNATRARATGLAQRLRLVGLSPQAALTGNYSSTYVLRAPASGVVTSVSVTAGSYVQPADVLAHLTSSADLYAELTVFEQDLPRIRPGQRVRLRLVTETGERTGRIKYVNRSFESDRSVRVVVGLDKADSRLLPNTFLKAFIELGESRVTALPEEALVSVDGQAFIFVVTDQETSGTQPPTAGRTGSTQPPATTTFRQIAVGRGATQGGYVAVVLPDGFDPTRARVVVKGAFAVLSQLAGAGGEDDE